MSERITQEELTEVQEFQRKLMDIIAELGIVSFEIGELDDALREQMKRRDELLNQVRSYRMQETDIVTRLREKYGAATLDFVTGEYTK